MMSRFPVQAVSFLLNKTSFFLSCFGMTNLFFDGNSSSNPKLPLSAPLGGVFTGDMDSF